MSVGLGPRSTERGFDYDTYRDLLGWIGAERPFVTFDRAAVDPQAPWCLLRHDVDYSLPAALEMARVEAELGITATYFLMLSGADYNLMSPGDHGVPAQLTALGHEVGLHYDPRLPSDLRGGAVDYYELQAELLGRLSGTVVSAMSRHNPSTLTADPLDGRTRLISAYEPRFTSEIVYVSDSCGAWRDDAVALFAAPAPPPRLQLLIHPIFWGDAPADRWTRLEALVASQHRAVDERASLARRLWRNHQGVAEHVRRAVRAGGSC
jgi:hypothetical protein